MRLSKKYFRIRFTLLLAPIATLFFVFNCYVVIRDYLNLKVDLKKSEFIIEKFQNNTYIEKRFYKPDITHKCFDISIKDQKFIIRLSDNFHSYKWKEIERQFSTGDTVKVLFANRLLQNTILYNPDELKINNMSVISYTTNKKITSYFLLALIILCLLFGFISFIAFKTYKEELFREDAILFKKSKSKLLGRWFGE